MTVLSGTASTGVGDLVLAAVVVDGALPALEADRLLRDCPGLRALVVRDRTALGLLSRARVEQLLRGPHGRAVLAARCAADLLPADTLVLPAEAPVALAARAALRRPFDQQDDDLVVTFDEDGVERVGLLPVSCVLPAGSALPDVPEQRTPEGRAAPVR